MSRIAGFPVALVLLLANHAWGQELTLTIEYVIYDCDHEPLLFGQFVGGDPQDREKRFAAAMKLRQEAPVRDSARCVIVVAVGQTTMQACQFGYNEIRVIAKPQPQGDDGSYPMELGMACALPAKRGSLTASSNWSNNTLLPLNEIKILGSSASETRNPAGKVVQRELGIWFVTLSLGKPADGPERDFLDIEPRFKPQVRPNRAAHNMRSSQEVPG